METEKSFAIAHRRFFPDRFAQGLLNRVAWGIGIDLYLMDGYGLGHHTWENVKDDLRFVLDPSLTEISGLQAHRAAARLEDLMAVWHHDETWRQGQELALLLRSVDELALVGIDEALRLVATRVDVV